MAFKGTRLNPSEQPWDTTGYTHLSDPNLSEVHRAMEYNAAGKPSIRTSVSPNNRTAFGETYGIEITPTIQLTPVYGFDAKNYTTTTTNVNATIGAADGGIDLTAGPVVAGVPTIAVFRSKKFFRYRAGQGALGRWNCAFSTPLAGTEQRAGFFSFEEAIQFAYNGTEFGILHIHNKKMRVEQFTITTPPTGTETATVTLDGVVYSFSVSGTAQSVAHQIAMYSGFNNALILTDSNDNTVTFVYLNNGATDTGNFSITSSGAMVVSRLTLELPSLGSTDRYPQSEWSVDPMDGTGPSGAVLDPTKYNVYQVSFSWLGSGKIDFFIENPDTGELALVHQIIWVNRFRTLNTESPSFAIGAGLFNFLDAGTLTLLFGSMMGANEGVIQHTTYSKATSVTKSNLTSNSIHHLLTLRNPYERNSQLNYTDTIVDTMTVSYQGNDPLEIFVYLTEPLATGTQQFVSLEGAVTVKSTATGTFSNTITPIMAFTIAPGGSTTIDLTRYQAIIPPGSELSFSVQSTQSITRIAASVIWIED